MSKTGQPTRFCRLCGQRCDDDLPCGCGARPVESKAATALRRIRAIASDALAGLPVGAVIEGAGLTDELRADLAEILAEIRKVGV